MVDEPDSDPGLDPIATVIVLLDRPELEHARLLFRTGYFAGRADRLLGREHFAPLVRALGDRITPEQLAAWRAEAAELGVPPEDPTEQPTP